MTHGERAPGEKLAIRLSTRLRRAEGLLDTSRVSARITRRGAPDRALGSSLAQRVDRWRASPMLRWAIASMGADAAPRWSSFGPELVLAAPPLEPSTESADFTAPSPTRRPGRFVADPVPGARRAVPLGERSPRGVAAADPGPAHTAAFPWATPLAAGLQPQLVPQPARQAQSAPHRHGELLRAHARSYVQPSPTPVRSHWAGRVLGPSPSPARPGARPWRGPRAPQAVVAWPDQPVPAQDPALAGSGRSRSARIPSARPGRALSAHGSDVGVQSFGAAQERAQLQTDIEPSAGHGPAPAAGLPGPRPAALRALHQRTEPHAPGAPLAGPDATDPPGSWSSSLPQVAPAARVASGLEQHPSRGVITALARAGSQQQAAQVAVAHADQLVSAQGLPAPLADLARQLGNEIRRASSAKQVAKDPVVARGASRPSAAEERARLQLAKVVKSSESTPVVSLASQRLIRRLQNLVHIAEVDRRRLEAQRHVRMAEDSAQARAQGSADLSSDGEGNEQPVDLDALGREVLMAVTNIRDSRTVRRPEDPDVPVANF